MLNVSGNISVNNVDLQLINFSRFSLLFSSTPSVAFVIFAQIRL